MSVTSLWGRLAMEDKIADFEQSLSVNKGVTLTIFGWLDLLKMKELFGEFFKLHSKHTLYTANKKFLSKKYLLKCNIIPSYSRF